MVARELLSRLPVFRDAGLRVQSALADISERVELRAGQVLFRQGDPSDRLYAVLSGRVEVRRSLPGGREVTVDIVGPEGLVGWSALTPPHRRRLSCLALERAELLSMDAAGLRVLCTAFPEFGVELMNVVSQTISRRLDAAAALSLGAPTPLQSQGVAWA